MAEKIIEPTEILVDGPKVTREDAARANPWLRFIARFFDYALFFLFLWSLRRFVPGHYPFGQFESLIPFEYFCWIPFEALFLSLLGTTPGKFLLGIQIRQGRKTRIDFLTALRRSFSVWFRGLGMGIPVLNVLCMLFAYQKLKLIHQASWDRDERILVTHRKIGSWRAVLAILVAIGGLLFYYSDKNSSSKNANFSRGKKIGRHF